jgi:hypothetical protein
MTLYLPQKLDSAKATLSKRGYADDEIDFAVRTSRDFGLLEITRETESGESLLFNPKAFEGNADDVYKAINSLKPKQKQLAADLLNFVVSNPGVPVPKNTDKEALALLINLGIIDYSKITTSQTRKGVYFPTTPYVWGVFDKSAGKEISKDLIDDSKLLLNSFRYGCAASAGNGKHVHPFKIAERTYEERTKALQCRGEGGYFEAAPLG